MKLIKTGALLVVIFVVLLITALSITYFGFHIFPIPVIGKIPNNIPPGFHLVFGVKINTPDKRNSSSFDFFNDKNQDILFISEENGVTNCSKNRKPPKDSTKTISITEIDGPSLTTTNDYCYTKLTAPKTEKYLFVWKVNDVKYSILTTGFKLDDYQLLKMADKVNKKVIHFNNLNEIKKYTDAMSL